MIGFTRLWHLLPIALLNAPVTQAPGDGERCPGPEFVGRAPLTHGSTMAGLDRELQAAQADADLVRAHGSHGDWQELRVWTAAEGGSGFESDPRPAYRLPAGGGREGYTPVRWRSSRPDREVPTNPGDGAQGPDPSRGIEVFTVQEPFTLFSEPGPGALFLIRENGTQRVFEPAPASSQSLSVENLPGGQYRVCLEDPRFLPVEVKEVGPGEALQIDLVGNAAAEVELTGPDGQVYTGPIEVAARFPSGFGQSYTADAYSVEPVLLAPGRWALEGLLPVPQELRIRGRSGDGVVLASEVLGDLEPQERRTLSLGLGPGERYSGRLLEYDGRACANGSVQLMDISNPASSWPPLIAATETDAQGRFELVAALGTPVRLVFSPGGYRSLVYRDGQEFLRLGPEPDVWLPEPGRLVVDLKLPAEGPEVEIELHLERIDELIGHGPYDLLFGDSDDAGTYTLGAEQHNEIEGLGPGSYLMWISAEPNTDRVWYPRKVFRRFELGAGEAQHIDLDASGETHGVLELSLALNGQPPVGKNFILTIDAGLGPVRYRLQLDANGRARLEDLPKGPARIAVVSATRSDDLMYLLEPFELEPGASLTVRREWSECDGRLRIVGEGSRPRRATQLQLSYSDPLRFGPGLRVTNIWVVTDAEGWLDLELLPGKYQLRPRGGGPWTEFEWSADGLGPLRELRVGGDGPKAGR